jgi:hypothetical protein
MCWQEGDPVALLVSDVVYHHLLERTVGSLCMAVRRVERRRHSQFDLEELMKLQPELSREPNIPVRYDLPSQTVATVNMIEVETGRFPKSPNPP